MNLDNLNWSLEFYEENVDACNSVLKSLKSYENIPLINFSQLQNFADGALVRYQGMVQDMLNPEYYSSTYTVLNKDTNEKQLKSGKFRDVVYCKLNEEVNEIDSLPKERLVFYCIPLPGTNDWVYNHLKNTSSFQNIERVITSNKRKMSEDLEEQMETDQVDTATQSNVKRNKNNDDNAVLENKIYSNSKYLPFPNEHGFPCLIKYYEEEEKSNIFLNDRIEAIGFLSLSPILEANQEETSLEEKEHSPPPSLVPRIHSVIIRKLEHYNPLLRHVDLNDDITFAEKARSDLHLALTQLLFEDEIAADYLLCHLLSRIYIRNDSHTIGKFSLNLFNVNVKDFGFCLYEILKTLVTNSHFVPLSTHLLNETSFIPQKDYDTNRLCSGLLQLCDGIHLVLDETKMNEGQLNNKGCLNVAALQRLCRDQEIQYDFGYYPVTYNTNIPLLILSEGKSMFETDFKIKVKSEFGTESSLKESFEAVRLYLKEEVCDNIRIFLTSMSLKDFELSEDMVAKIGEDYVSMRQQDRKVNSSDLNNLLVLSRLLALSHGRTVLCQDDWKRAVEMEAERKLR